ncbi:hypothetical protein [Kitasatospora acidiphila]|nr:hypothetical protein [Kitasatospora acidiphila]
MELVVGYFFAWAVRKARRVAGRADAEVDSALDAGMERLHEVVVSRLGAEPALKNMTQEAASERAELTVRTRKRLELALEEAADQDAEFAEALQQAVNQVEAADEPAGPESGKYNIGGITTNGNTAIVIGDGNKQNNTFK